MMSNEFEVHDFYDYTVEELKELKEEFICRCDSAIGYKESLDDLSNCKSLKEWEKKWEGETDDEQAYQLAQEYYK